MFFLFIDNIVIFVSNGMITSFWEPHLKDTVSATQYQVAVVFFLMGASYMITTVPTGMVSMDPM